jgi:hypothetical protein
VCGSVWDPPPTTCKKEQGAILVRDQSSVEINTHRSHGPNSPHRQFLSLACGRSWFCLLAHYQSMSWSDARRGCITAIKWLSECTWKHRLRVWYKGRRSTRMRNTLDLLTCETQNRLLTNKAEHLGKGFEPARWSGWC